MQITIRQLLLLLLALAALLLAGCGYHSVVARGPLGDANGVNVVLFANRSYRPNLPGLLARNLIDELALRTGGKVLSGREADLELNGTILDYSSTAISYSQLDVIKEYTSSITVQAVLLDNRTRKVLWKQDLTEQQVFPVNQNIALQQNAEEAAIEKISRRLSEDIWRKISERF